MMKKNLVLAALACAAMCVPAFAKSATGRLTGISVSGDTATVTIDEGIVDVFNNNEFKKSGASLTETMPLTVKVERVNPNGQANANPMRPANVPQLSVRNLRIDQVISITYGEDGKTVEKISCLNRNRVPQMQRPAVRPQPFAKAKPAMPNRRPAAPNNMPNARKGQNTNKR